ncbi:MAG: hypothetical protein CFK48_11760 [Armatimonadetes bacterium CP1_7O]|nr:MAG: hypothetical protein CFK48_11760 [Armatimonadetes bacterium CP1_7O]
MSKHKTLRRNIDAFGDGPQPAAPTADAPVAEDHEAPAKTGQAGITYPHEIDGIGVIRPQQED